MKLYTIRVLIAFDQLINTITGGYPNETLSARAWRLGHIGGNPVWKAIHRATDIVFDDFHPDHCKGSYEHIIQPSNVFGIYHPVDYQPEIRIPIDLPPEWPTS